MTPPPPGTPRPLPARLGAVRARLAALTAARRPPPVPDAPALAAAAGYDLDVWQRDALAATAPRLALNCARQSGKSTVAALLAAEAALAAPDGLVLLAAPGLRQAQELYRTVHGLLAAHTATVAIEAESALRVELGNGSRVIALPGTPATVRGYAAVRLLCIDEAARTPDELYFTLLPTLVRSGGRLVTMSTPWGRRGWWSAVWHDAAGTGAGADWARVCVPADQCPRLAPAALARLRQDLGAWWAAQELDCQFMDAETAAFRSEDIARAFVSDLAAWPLGSYSDIAG